jgi:glycosyltransferase involved in cell wall biosynthesis
MTDTSRDLSIVIPAFNEEGGIGSVLAQLVEAFPQAQLIVVDDCSDDGTRREAEKCAAAEIHSHPFNRGYGASLRTGMLAANREYVAWFDADNEHRTVDLREMFEIIRRDRLAAVIGQRINPSLTLTRAVGKFIIRSIGRTLDIKVGADLNCGLRIFRRDIITRYVSVLPERYSASMTTTMLMAERQYPIAFFPVQTDHRIGTSKVKLRDGFIAITKLIRLIMLFAPMRIFFRLGLLLVAIGMAYGLYVSLEDRLGFPVAGMLVATVGTLLCMLGLIADQISQFWLMQLGSSSPATAANRAPLPLDQHGEPAAHSPVQEDRG